MARQKEEREVGLFEGGTLMLPCNPHNVTSVPEATVFWMRKTTITDAEGDVVREDDRIQIDEQGNLRLRNVMKDDVGVKSLYTCRLFNNYLDTSVGASYYRLILNHTAVGSTDRVLLYKTPHKAKYLKGQDITLRCFFSGLTTNVWRGPDGKVIDTGKQFGKLVLSKVSSLDDGNYTCTGQDELGNEADQSHIISVVVQEGPEWKVVNGLVRKPSNRNATEGADVTFLCEATSIPPAEITWFINGALSSEPMVLPENGKLCPNKTCLTFMNVTKDLNLMNIQCNVSNEHSYLYADAYLNILEKTKVTVMKDLIDLSLTESLVLNCTVEGDDSTKIDISWERNGIILENQKYIRTWKSPKTDGMQMTHLEILTTKVGRNYSDLVDTYRCKASNDYSSDVGQIVVKWPEDVSPVLILSKSSNISIGPCEEVTLDCEVITFIHLPDDKAPSVYWLKDDVPLVEVEQPMIIFENNTVVLKSKQQLDGGYSVTGKYICIVETNDGAANITIGVRTTMTSRPVLMFCNLWYWSFIVVPCALVLIMFVGLLCIAKCPISKRGDYTIEQNEKKLRCKKQEERLAYWMSEYNKSDDRRSIKPTLHSDFTPKEGINSPKMRCHSSNFSELQPHKEPRKIVARPV